MLFTLVLAGLFGYLTFKYTKSFEAWNRQFVWLFVVFGVVYTLMFLSDFFLWKTVARKYLEKNNASSSNWRTRKRKLPPMIVKLRRFKRKFNVNGAYYMWKLYFMEFVESMNQLSNCFTLYLCTLPVHVTSSLALVLSADAFFVFISCNKRRRRQEETGR